jgi:hypothetical protein
VKTAIDLRPPRSIEAQTAEHSFKMADRGRKTGVVEPGDTHLGSSSLEEPPPIELEPDWGMC